MTLKNHGSSHMSTFGDFDGDGDLDMFASNTGESVGSQWAAPLFKFENSGSSSAPNFGSGTPVLDIYGDEIISMGLNIYPTACDLDEDGDIDLMIGENENLRYYENNGNDEFEMLGELFVVPGEWSTGVQCTFGDLNNDGKTDIVYTTHYYSDPAAKFFVRFGI